MHKNSPENYQTVSKFFSHFAALHLHAPLLMINLSRFVFKSEISIANVGLASLRIWASKWKVASLRGSWFYSERAARTSLTWTSFTDPSLVFEPAMNRSRPLFTAAIKSMTVLGQHESMNKLAFFDFDRGVRPQSLSKCSPVKWVLWKLKQIAAKWTNDSW